MRAGLALARVARLALLAIPLLAACGGAAPTVRPVDATRLDPNRLFPLESGTVWSFNVRTGIGLPTFATLRVLDATATTASVQSNRQAPERYEHDATGVRHADGTYVLKAPIALDATWSSGATRTSRVASVDESVRTGLGELTGCVRVVELDSDTEIEATTVYCPDVGPALIVSRMTSHLSGETLEVRAELIGRTVLEDAH